MWHNPLIRNCLQTRAFQSGALTLTPSIAVCFAPPPTLPSARCSSFSTIARTPFAPLPSPRVSLFAQRHAASIFSRTFSNTTSIFSSSSAFSSFSPFSSSASSSSSSSSSTSSSSSSNPEEDEFSKVRKTTFFDKLDKVGVMIKRLLGPVMIAGMAYMIYQMAASGTSAQDLELSALTGEFFNLSVNFHDAVDKVVELYEEEHREEEEANALLLSSSSNSTADNEKEGQEGQEGQEEQEQGEEKVIETTVAATEEDGEEKVNVEAIMAQTTLAAKADRAIARSQEIDRLERQINAVEDRRASVTARLLDLLSETPPYYILHKYPMLLRGLVQEMTHLRNRDPFFQIKASEILHTFLRDEQLRPGVLQLFAKQELMEMLLRVLERPMNGRRVFCPPAASHVFASLSLILQPGVPDAYLQAFERENGFARIFRRYTFEETTIGTQGSHIENSLPELAALISDLSVLHIERPSLFGPPGSLSPELRKVVAGIVASVIGAQLELYKIEPLVSEKARLLAKISQLTTALHHVDPTDNQALINLGMLLQLSIPEMALETFRLAYRANPDPQATWLLARLLAASEQASELQEAVTLLLNLRKDLERAAAVGLPLSRLDNTSNNKNNNYNNNNSSNNNNNNNEIDAVDLLGVLSLLSSLFAQLGQQEDAIEALRSACKRYPEARDTQLRLASLLLQVADQTGARGRQSEEAFYTINKVLQAEPANQEALLLLGRAHEQEGRHELAAATYRRIEPADRRTLEAMARNDLKRGQPLEAVEAWKRAVSLDPLDWQPLMEIARIYQSLGQPFAQQLAQQHLRVVNCWHDLLDIDDSLFDDPAVQTALAEIAPSSPQIQSALASLHARAQSAQLLLERKHHPQVKFLKP